MGFDGCGEEFETWTDDSGLWGEDCSFQIKVNITAWHIGFERGIGGFWRCMFWV